jgi:hypothetical protein
MTGEHEACSAGFPPPCGEGSGGAQSEHCPFFSKHRGCYRTSPLPGGRGAGMRVVPSPEKAHPSPGAALRPLHRQSGVPDLRQRRLISATPEITGEVCQRQLSHCLTRSPHPHLPLLPTKGRRVPALPWFGRAAFPRHGRACPGHPRSGKRRARQTVAGRGTAGARSQFVLDSGLKISYIVTCPGSRGARSRGVARCGAGTRSRDRPRTPAGGRPCVPRGCAVRLKEPCAGGRSVPHTSLDLEPDRSSRDPSTSKPRTSRTGPGAAPACPLGSLTITGCTARHGPPVPAPARGGAG